MPGAFGFTAFGCFGLSLSAFSLRERARDVSFFCGSYSSLARLGGSEHYELFRLLGSSVNNPLYYFGA